MKLVIIDGPDMPLSEMPILRKLIANNFRPSLIPALSKDKSSKAALADLAWFKANPSRRYHLRRAMKGDEWLGAIEVVVVRKDDAGLRPIPVPVDFLIPDKEDFAEVSYLMALEFIREIGCAYAAGKAEVKYPSMDELAACVFARRLQRMSA